MEGTIRSRTDQQWREYCAEHITAGYTPGGNAGLTYDTGVNMARFLHSRGIVKNGMRVLDVGCGNGRLAMGLLNCDIAYQGLDVIKPSIEFCRGAFKGYANYSFAHLDVYNAHYWTDGRTLPQNVVYPVVSGSVDLVTAFSLFSHTENIAVAERNLSEMLRTLKVNGSIFSTWSLTTQKAEVRPVAKHTIYHINDVLNMLSGFSYQLITLEEFNETNPNQIGIWLKKGT